MNTSTRRIENDKKFDYELNFIKNLHTLENHEIMIFEQEDIKIDISKTPEAFKVKVGARLTEENDEKIAFSFILNKNKYDIKNIGNTRNDTELIRDKSVNFQTTI